MDQNKITLILGDCIEQLRAIPDNYVDSVVCDPPYNYNFMGKKWDNHDSSKNFQEWCERWGIELLKVLKPGAHILSFGGTRTYHRMTSGLEDAGFEIKDCLMWIYGSGFPKSRNIYKDTELEEHIGLGTSLKPAYEPIILARKPFKGTIAKNVIKNGTGALNIKDCRIGTETLPAQKAGQAKIGTFERENMITPEREGRWPANVLFDEEAAAVLDEQTGILKSGDNCVRSKVGSFLEHGGLGKPGDIQTTYGDSGGASRFFYCAKASTKERNLGLDEFEKKRVRQSGHKDQRVWDIPGSHATVRANFHPTVKPIELTRYLIRLITPSDGTVLDPFMGSGTTGIAAALEGFNFIGIELEEEHLEIAKTRINYWKEHKIAT